MTIYEMFKNKTVDELAEWFDEHCMFDNSPWILWWDENYCKKCETEFCYVESVEKELEFAWCELNNDRCRFFQNMDEMPDNKQIIKMWLNSDIENLDKYL